MAYYALFILKWDSILDNINGVKNIRSVNVTAKQAAIKC